MATATMTQTQTETMPKVKGKRMPAAQLKKLAPENERYMRACADIANALVEDFEHTQQTGEIGRAHV